MAGVLLLPILPDGPPRFPARRDTRGSGQGDDLIAVEVLRGGATTSKSIQENRLKDLTYFIEGRQGGMQSLDQHLIELHQSGAISGTEAMRLASTPE